MNKKFINMQDLFSEQDILFMTEEAFPKKTIKIKYKRLLVIAAALAVMVGIFCVPVVNAAARNLFYFITESGLQDSDITKEYYILQEPVRFSGTDKTYSLDYVKRNGSDLVLTLSSVSNVPSGNHQSSGKATLRVDGKDIVGKVIRGGGGSRMSEYFVFSNVPKQNNIELLTEDGSQCEFTLSSPTQYDKSQIHRMQVDQFELSIVSMSGNNNRIGVDIKPPKDEKYVSYNLAMPKLTDKNGAEFFGMSIVPGNFPSSVSNNDTLHAETIDGIVADTKITTLRSAGILKNILNQQHSMKPLNTISLPNPKDGESVQCNQTVDVNGTPLTIRSVLRSGAEITLEIDKKTDYGEIDNVTMELKNNGKNSASGSNPSDGGSITFTLTENGKPETGKTIDVYLYELHIFIEHPIEIQF